MIMVYNRNVNIFYVKIHCLRNDDQQDSWNHKHNCQNRFVPEYQPEFFHQYKPEFFHCRRILKFFNEIVRSTTVIPIRITVSFHTY